MPRDLHRRRSRPTFEPLEGRALLATLTVINALDSGAGSLRQAILDADAASGSSTIDFAIPGTGVQRIFLRSGLPSISEPVTLDATTQPGYAGTPVVAVDGTYLPSEPAVFPGNTVNALAFVAGSSGSTVKGLAINRFGGSAIDDEGAEITVLDNFLGDDPTGAVTAGVGREGVLIDSAADPAAVAGSVISGNVIGSAEDNAIDLSAASGVTITGNFLGTDAGASTILGNGRDGIFADLGTANSTASGNTIVNNGYLAIEDRTGGGLATSNNTASNNGLRIANLSVTASTTSIDAATGQAVSVTYVVTDDGPADAVGARLDLTDQGAGSGLGSPVFAFTGSTSTQGGGQAGTSPTSYAVMIGDLSPGESATVTIDARVVGSGLDAINAAASSFNPNPPPAAASSSATITATGTTDLGVASFVSPDPPRVGRPETFTFLVTNNTIYNTHGLFALQFTDTTTGTAPMGVLTAQGTVTALPAFANGYGGDLGTISPGDSIAVTAIIIPPSGGVVSAALFAYSTADVDPTPANNLAYAASLIPAPATTLFGALIPRTGGTITTLDVLFDGDLDASEAQNVNNYQLTLAGSKARIAIASASYAATPLFGTVHEVVLQLAKVLPRQGQAFRLLVGRAGLTAADGSKLVNTVNPVTPTYQ